MDGEVYISLLFILHASFTAPTVPSHDRHSIRLPHPRVSSRRPLPSPGRAGGCRPAWWYVLGACRIFDPASPVGPAAFAATLTLERTQSLPHPRVDRIRHAAFHPPLEQSWGGRDSNRQSGRGPPSFCHPLHCQRHQHPRRQQSPSNTMRAAYSAVRAARAVTASASASTSRVGE